MPFSGFDLMTRINQVRQGLRDDLDRRAPRGSSRSSPRRAASARRRSRSTSPSSLGQARPADRADRRQPPVRRPAGAAQGAGRRAVDPRPADRPGRRIGPPGRPLARPVRDRHPARAAARRDGRDDHRPRHRQGPVAAAPGLRRDRHRHVVGPERHQPRVPRPVRHDRRDRHVRLDHDPQHGRGRRRVPDDRLLRRRRCATS